MQSTARITGRRAWLLPSRLAQHARLQSLRQTFCARTHSQQRLRPFATNAAPAASGSQSGYKSPPAEILKIVDAPAQPSLSFSPDRTLILQLFRPPSLPPLHELSRPELKLAGLRIDPDLFARSKMSYYTGMALVSADQLVPAPEEQCRPITGIPPSACINFVSWSPSGTLVAFTTCSKGGPSDPPRAPLELWVADVATGQARPVLQGGSQRPLNTVFDNYTWIDDNTIVAAVLPQGLGTPPERAPLPPGPKIQDNTSGRTSQIRTYPDLLKDDHDDQMFEHYCTSELLLIDVAQGTATTIGPPRLYTEIDPSPDGRYLLVSFLERPYSRSVPCGRFPRREQLWRRDGSLVSELAALPLAEDIPIAFNSCRKGPRGISWRPDKPAELSWIECQDEGDPAKEVSPRDIVYMMPADEAGSKSAPRVLATTDLRCGGVAWCDDDLAIVYESWWKTRRSRQLLVKPGAPEEGLKVLFDRNYEDAYTDPGSPLTRRTSDGTYILAKIDGKRQLLMQGQGASPEGNRPFLDLLDLDSGASRRIWQSSAPYYEVPGSLMCDNNNDEPISLEGLSLLLSRETVQDPPQTFIKTFTQDASQSTERQVTNYPHPYPQLRELQKEVIRYSREDGVFMTATLYLPPGYDKERDGPLPCLLWAYPREYKSKEAAGQMRRSPHTFASIGSSSPTLWVARGYAVLDGPSFPIVAEGDAEPNDTYVQQLTDSARAAITEVVRRGVVDPSKVTVGGHSYGAFMAANLLLHAPDLFAAGVACSGAYNRTLTPFGFQSEERTLWQAPDTYMKMSPFMGADKMKRPILLIHGDEDNNPGTLTMQSERLYAALKGHGVQTRLVLLPYESHSYRARESVLHKLYEMDQWMETYAGYGRVDPSHESEAQADS